MRTLCGTILAAACVFAANGATVTKATLGANGHIRFGGGVDYAVRPMLILPGWKSASAQGGYEVKYPGTATYRLDQGGETVADATTMLRQLDGGMAKAVFSLTPRKDIESISCGCTVGLPIAEVDGKPWGLQGKAGVFGKPAWAHSRPAGAQNMV